MEKFLQLFDRGVDAFERLNPREKLMLVMVIGVFLGGGGMLATSIVRGKLVIAEGRVFDKEDKLREIVDSRVAYEEAQALREQQKDLIRKAGGVRLFSFLEDLSKQTGVAISDMNERTLKSEDGKLEQTDVDATLNAVPWAKLTGLLDRIERSEHVVKVTKLRMKRRLDQDQTLDVQLTVSTFSIPEKEGG